MKFKSTFIFAALVAGLTVFSYFEFKKMQNGEVSEDKYKVKLSEKNSTEAVGLEVKSALNKYRINKDGVYWLVVEPLKDKADFDSVDSFLRELLSLQLEELDFTDGSPVDLAKYGLREGFTEININFKDQSTLKVKVGSVRSYDQGFYLQTDQQEKVFVSDISLEALLNKTVHQMRYRKLEIPEGNPVHFSFALTNFSHKSAASGSSEVHGNANKSGQNKKYSFSLVNDNWQFNGKDNAKIKSAQILDYITGLRHIMADDVFAESHDEALKKIKIKKEISTKFKLTSGDAVSDYSLRILLTEDDTTLFLGSNNHQVYKLKGSVFNDYNKEESYFFEQEQPKDKK